MTPELGSTEEQRREEERNRLEALQADNDFKWVMDSRPGRAFIWRLLGEAGLYRNPMQGDGDAFTNLRCGMQSIGQSVIEKIHRLCPDKYMVMVKEQQRSDDAAARPDQ